MPKTVWVLGAGFPRSLGAPLLDDLFRQETAADTGAYFDPAGFPGLARDMSATQVAFNWGKTAEHLWQDAEQFLSFVDDAYSGNAPAKRKRLDLLVLRAKEYDSEIGVHRNVQDGDVVNVLLKDLARATRRALAAETCRFMMSDRSGELWLPYREWAKVLNPEDDTIVTFNYDRLLDSLGERFTVPLPHEAPVSKRVPVLKLHGSVDWIEDGDKWQRVRPLEALTNPSGQAPAIAAPGRSKSPNGVPPFPRLWELAESALSQAQWVIFLGYRFPETDALAKFRLLEALRRDTAGRRLRRFDIVLGPSIESDASRRLARLLQSTLNGRHLVDESEARRVDPNLRRLVVVRQPLGAEDFLLTYQQFSNAEDW